MNSQPRRDIQCFDPKQEYAVCERRLPHWSQAGTVSFVTFRMWDSIPQPILNRWLKVSTPEGFCSVTACGLC